jgi:hypothetical protein
MAQKFQAGGYNVLLWERHGRTIHYGYEGLYDVLRVVEHVRVPAVDSQKLFVFGISLGRP